MAEQDILLLNNRDDSADISEMLDKYLTFWIDGQLFSVPITHVAQIIGVQEITPVPDFPHYAKGIINLRGNIIPIIDMRLRLDRPEREYDSHTCIIVMSMKGSNIGFVVDQVAEVATIKGESISPFKGFQDKQDAYITGIGKMEDKNILMLDAEKILGGGQLEALQQVWQ